MVRAALPVKGTAPKSFGPLGYCGVRAFDRSPVDTDEVQASLRRHGVLVSIEVSADVALFLASDPMPSTEIAVSGRDLLSGLPIEKTLFVEQLRWKDGLS